MVKRIGEIFNMIFLIKKEFNSAPRAIRSSKGYGGRFQTAGAKTGADIGF